jgi:hypothetical protein
MFKQYGLAANQSTLERYERLAAERRSGAHIPALPTWDAHLARGVGRRPGGNRPDPGQYIRVKRLVSDAVAEVQRDRRRAGQGGLGGALAGRDPGNFIEELDETFPDPVRPRLDWKTALRLFAAPQRRVFTTWSRRTAGTAPGWARSPGASSGPTRPGRSACWSQSTRRPA